MEIGGIIKVVKRGSGLDCRVTKIVPNNRKPQGDSLMEKDLSAHMTNFQHGFFSAPI